MSDPDRTAPGRGALETPIFLVAMLAVCALAWWLGDRPALAVDASPLAGLPTQIGRWKSAPLSLETEVEAELRADFNVLRAYWTPGEEPISLYVGYYGTARGGRPEHTPRFCYTGAGWGILSSKTVTLSRDRGLRATEYVVQRDQERQLVQYWYRSHRRSGILGGFDQNVDRLFGMLLDGRADGALVRISTAIRDGDVDTARSRLLSFGSAIDAKLAEHWPIEARGDVRVAELEPRYTGESGDAIEGATGREPAGVSLP